MKSKFVAVVIGFFAVAVLHAAEPSPPAQDEVVARVFDKKIYRKEIEPPEEQRKVDEKLFPNQKWENLVVQYRNDNLASLIWEPLKEKFVQEQKIQVTEKDLDNFADAMMAGQPQIKEMDEKLIKDAEDKLKQEGLTPEKRAELEQSIKASKESLAVSDDDQRKGYRMTGKSMIEAWKINQALYKIYGGRVIFQQAGIEPLDAYKKFLEEHEKKGDFEILDKTLREEFWKYYTTMHTEVPKKQVDFRTPWWTKMKKPQEGKP